VDGAVVRHVTVVENGPETTAPAVEMAKAGSGGGTGDVVTGGVTTPRRACIPPNHTAPTTETRSNADPATNSARGLGHPRTREP
jgi:hypothetical protein